MKNETKMKFKSPIYQLHPRSISDRAGQKGVVLFVALIVLVAMSLAGVSMLRAVDTGTQVAGNLSQRQSAIHAAERAFDPALKKIVVMNNSGAGRSGDPTFGYSEWDVAGKVSQRNWAAAWNFGKDPDTGDDLDLLIDRLCDGLEDCQQTLGTATQAPGQSKNCVGAGCKIRPVFRHYRLIARVTDPKGAPVYVEMKIN
jgi:type IV pilus assembly protein PilX